MPPKRSKSKPAVVSATVVAKKTKKLIEGEKEVEEAAEESVEVVAAVFESEEETPSSQQQQQQQKERERTTKNKKMKRRRKRSASYKTYLHRVLKQVHPELGISSKAMTVLNSFVVDMLERLANEAARLLRYAGRRTMSSREVQGAVRLVLPGELGKHADAEGTKAVTNYMSSSVRSRTRRNA